MGIKSGKGFTLLELVVSIGILGILITHLLGIFMVSIKNNVYARAITGAVATAQRVMEWYMSEDFDYLRDRMTEISSTSVSCTKYIFSMEDSQLSRELGDYDSGWYRGEGSENSVEDMEVRAAKEGIEDYDFAVKTVLTFCTGSDNTSETIKINISVWNPISGNRGKVNLLSLRGSIDEE